LILIVLNARIWNGLKAFRKPSVATRLLPNQKGRMPLFDENGNSGAWQYSCRGTEHDIQIEMWNAEEGVGDERGGRVGRGEQRRQRPA